MTEGSVFFSADRAASYKKFIQDVRGWQFLTIEVAETLCMVFLPPEKHIFRKNI